jgi:hypothetical protein
MATYGCYRTNHHACRNCSGRGPVILHHDAQPMPLRLSSCTRHAALPSAANTASGTSINMIHQHRLVILNIQTSMTQPLDGSYCTPELNSLIWVDVDIIYVNEPSETAQTLLIMNVYSVTNIKCVSRLSYSASWSSPGYTEACSLLLCTSLSHLQCAHCHRLPSPSLTSLQVLLSDHTAYGSVSPLSLPHRADRLRPATALSLPARCLFYHLPIWLMSQYSDSLVNILIFML